ncbi:beta-ketoacyl synthase N-terminal-like domain-containing protein [Streptomyces sp. NPDC047315]|uniref:beta-ketoacyl synthase N-terminal-like domain-containing protein n=1 Tax=Streptomyces sp. NPDC047315 TaxID=3155142 RepID=UPI00340FA7E0
MRTALEELDARRRRAEPTAGATLAAAFVDVLTSTLEQLPAAVRTTVPVILAAADYSVETTSAYVSRCAEAEAGGRRLRPSEAMSPEPAQLLQHLAEPGTWRGPGYVLISPGTAAEQAVRWARAAVTTGLHPAVVVSQVVRDAGQAAFRVAAVPVTPQPAAPPPRAPTDAVVISGTGLVTAFGAGTDAFWRALLDGRRALGELTRFDASRFRSRTVCQVPGDGPGAAGGPVRRAFADRAGTEALRDAGMTRLPARTLLVAAGVVPHLPQVADAPRIDEIALEPNWAGGGFGVPAGAVSDAAVVAHACASGAFGLAMAREWLLSGLAEVAVVTGVSALNPYDYACLDVLRATTTDVARPFDEHRSGVTIGEGAGAIVLERADRAAARGHPPRATLDAVACRVAGQGISRLNAHISADCVRTVLTSAGVTSVDHVHGHAPGTRQGDEAELSALDGIGAEHGWREVSVSSHKGATGHLLHASAFPAVVTAVRALRHGTVPGTPGLRAPLAARHVRVLRTPEPCPGIRSVLVNNFGFGGNNAALLLTGRTGAPDGRLEWSTHG